ncbi:MAG: LysR family transcriptional regulator [Burkholderiaceae bacterium]|jgi:DNA-binding transcriptional LysR family regulator|nr:LysR family transcriptional regulator [Burkholderiaceae bacterium]
MKASSDHLGDVKLFIAVTEVGSLTVAAKKFGYSVAAASVRLTKLENYLGAKLFNRSTKRLEITQDGMEYLKSCSMAVQMLEDAEQKIRVEQKTAVGNIKISAATDFGRYYLFEWLDEFSLKYPKVKVSLMLEDSYSDLLKDVIDVAIRFGRPRESALMVKRLASNYRVLCASPEYLEAHGTPATPEDLAAHEFIVLATSRGVLNEYYFAGPAGQTSYTLPANSTWVVNDGQLATQWALAGRGITRKTIWDVARYLRSGKLNIVLSDYIVQEEGIFSVRSNNKYLPKRMRVFLDFLESKFNQESELLRDYLHNPGLGKDA